MRYTYLDRPLTLRGTRLLWIIVALIASCSPSPKANQTPNSSPTPQTTAQTNIVKAIQNPVMGETLYVPIYSHIYATDRQSKLNLTATLSIRNADPQRAFIINAVRYYDSDGRLVRQYLDQPIKLNALATKDFVVPSNDNTGGAGANFIVEWVAEQKVAEPIVEAVMIGTEGNRGFSFVSPARVTKRLTSSSSK